MKQISTLSHSVSVISARDVSDITFFDVLYTPSIYQQLLLENKIDKSINPKETVRKYFINNPNNYIYLMNKDGDLVIGYSDNNKYLKHINFLKHILAYFEKFNLNFKYEIHSKNFRHTLRILSPSFIFDFILDLDGLKIIPVYIKQIEGSEIYIQLYTFNFNEYVEEYYETYAFLMMCERERLIKRFEKDLKLINRRSELTFNDFVDVSRCSNNFTEIIKNDPRVNEFKEQSSMILYFLSRFGDMYLNTLDKYETNILVYNIFKFIRNTEVKND
jgi:hypothetical protein